MNIKGITFEFFRYVLVGGSAFLIDIGTLFLVQTYLLFTWGAAGVLISTAIGFIAGLIFNYIFSNLFVFKKIDKKVKKHPVRSFTIFTIIGIIGLGLTEIGMFAGIKLLGLDYYLFVKIFTAAIVLLWNYIARKVFIFKRIGGISTTIEYKGNRIDIGGHRFFSKNQQVNDFWEALMPVQGQPAKDDILLNVQKDFQSEEPDPEKTDIVMLIRNRVSRIFYQRKFFDYPISIKTSTFVNMGLWNTIKAGCSYLYSSVKKREENSLEDFYINRFGKQLYRMFFEDYTEKVWGMHPSKLSSSWGAQRVKSLSILNILNEAILKFFKPQYESKQTSLIDRFLYPKLGPGQLWSVVANEIEKMGGRIHINTKVVKVEVENQTVKVISVEENGKIETFPVDYLFSTMPVKDLIQAIESNVPAEVTRIASDLPYRDFITVGLLVNKLKLKNQTKIQTVGNIVPDCWIYIQDRDVRIGRIQIFNNWSPYMVKDYQNTVWIGIFLQ